MYRREGLNDFYGVQLKLLEAQMKDAQEHLRVMRDDIVKRRAPGLHRGLPLFDFLRIGFRTRVRRHRCGELVEVNKQSQCTNETSRDGM